MCYVMLLLYLFIFGSTVSLYSKMNGVSFINKTAEQATLEIVKPTDSVQLLVQYDYSGAMTSLRVLFLLAFHIICIIWFHHFQTVQILFDFLIGFSFRFQKGKRTKLRFILCQVATIG